MNKDHFITGTFVLFKGFSFILLTVLSSCLIQSEDGKGKGVFIQEPANPQQNVNIKNWDGISVGLHASWGDLYQRYLQDDIPGFLSGETLSLESWKNERVLAQLVIWSTDSIRNLSIKIEDLKSAKDKIPSSAINHYYVRNVITDEFGEKGCGPREKDPGTANLVPDPLETITVYSHPGKTTRAVYIVIQVPEEITSGEYLGNVKILKNGKTLKKLQLQLNISDQKLPDPEHWAFHLDLWQNPFSVARTAGTGLWSDEHFEAMRPLYQMLADAGQKCITASISPQPWGGQTLDPFESMVSRTLKKDGSWHFNYTVLDQWIDFMMDIGIRNEINCYSLISWNEQYGYYCEQKNKDITLNLIAGSNDYIEFWRPFLEDFSDHMASRGLLDITTLSMDERPPEQIKSVVLMVREFAPELKISMATNKEFHMDEIYDLSIGIRFLPEAEVFQNRKEQGLITTFYVACNPAFPNTYTFSPPAESSWLAWFAYANGLDGFLRWAYNSWVEDPLTDTRFRRWPGGDAFLVYPGPRSSIRFEMLRDGIEDYEKLKIITEKLTNRSGSQADNLQNELNSMLNGFKTYPPVQKEIQPKIEQAKTFINNIE
jgi:hypothetical protein